MPILPDDFDRMNALELLRELEQGKIGFDHRLIRRLLSTPQETIEALVTVAAAPADDRLLELNEQIFDLFRQLKAPEAIDFYLEMLRSREGDEIPDELIEALADLGEAAVEPLLALHAEQEEESTDIVFVLAALGTHDPRISALIEQTIRRDPYEGAICAGLYRGEDLKPALESAFQALDPALEQERKAVEDALAAIANPPEKEERPAPAIYALYPEESFPVFDALPESTVLEFLTSESAAYRSEAALSFVDTEYGDGIRDELMRMAAEDQDSAARGTALAALGERLDEPMVRELLYAALDRFEELPVAERTGVLLGLASEAGKPEVEKRLLELYGEPETRALAMEAMYRSVDPRYAERFPANLHHDDEQVRRQAIRGIGVFGIESSAIELVPFFQDDALREDALYAYALAAPGKDTEKGAHRLFEEIDQKADGLSSSEADLVAEALDQRLERAGMPAVFFPDEHEHSHEPVEQLRSEKIGRNDPCPCGSGKKYKKCCGASS